MRRLLPLAALLGLFACAVESDDDLDDTTEDSALTEGSAETRAILRLVNDAAVAKEELVSKAKVASATAGRIVAHRNGVDGAAGTNDDNPFDTLAELKGERVGAATLKKLLDYAKARGLLSSAEVVFSPQAYDQSHLAKVAALIAGAKESIDIAMYSFSDAGISTALEAATARGVKVRFMFETGGDDSRKPALTIQNTKSWQLEKRGVDVRFVNKIMHHKFMIVDGPRDAMDRANGARIVTGSANWSSGGATRYDENTLFLNGEPELALKLQREFNTLWEHSRDFVSTRPFEYQPSTLAIVDPVTPDNPGIEAFFTSSNFVPTGTTFRANGKDTVADALVRAIKGAEKSIHIASGHLRSRPVAEALEAKRAQAPTVDIRVYLDSQEYISKSGHDAQVAERAACITAAAGNASALANCNDNGFLFGYEAGLAGVSVKYKYYAYRWDASYAPQMHNKFMIVDAKALYTGSYNLSDNAEHETFENMLSFSGPAYAALVASYEKTFEKLWRTGEAEGKLAELEGRLTGTGPVPIVFDAVALDWTQITTLKAKIRAACPAVDSDEYRQNAPGHLTCIR
jgi:phosphatidylserine/phosphatidylglycerophosphate/cardiolipin synthase-like enzyme